jgi:hypothetical protein
MSKGCRMTRRKDSQSHTPESAAADVTGTAPDPFVEPVTPGPVAAPDVLADPSPEPPPPPTAPAAAPPPRASSLAPLLGGALAGVAGFALSHFDLLGLSAPDAPAEVAALSAQLAELEAKQSVALDEISGNLGAATARIADLEAQPAREMPDLSRLDGLERRLADIESIPDDSAGSNAALTAKIADLDRRLSAMPATAGSPDLRAQLDAALDRLDAAEAAATTRAAEAEAAAAAAARAQALDALSNAVVEGRPFAPELQALADPTLSAALDPQAATGVPTLASLQSTFPAAARDALALSREMDTEDGWTDRLVDFLAAQTGARSVTPREGTTPDAILSRAEFALTEGRVTDAVAELDALDAALKPPLETWIAEARTHLAAAAALAAARGE